MGGYPFCLLTAFAATFPKGSVLALSVTCGDSSPKGRALGIAIQFPAKVQSLPACPLPLGGAVAQRLRGFESAEPEKTVKRSSRRTGVNLQFFPVELTSLGLKGASSPFFVAPARRNRWHFSGSLLVSKENIPRLRGFSQLSYFFASAIRLRFSSRMRSSTTLTALRMRALGMRTASVAHG